MSKPDYDWKIQRNLALIRDGGMCQAAKFGLDTPCRSFPPGPVVHHIRRRKGPDPHALDGLVTLCGWHHDHVHANVAESYQSGLLARSTTVAT